MAYKNLEQLKRILSVNGSGARIVGDAPDSPKPARVRKSKTKVAPVYPPVRFVFALPLPPSANRYWRNYKGVVVVSEEAKAYKRTVNGLASQIQIQPAQGPLAIWLVYYFQRQAVDLDNRIKVCLDAMQGIFYENDNQFDEIHMKRCYDKKNPRVEIVIESMPA